MSAVRASKENSAALRTSALRAFTFILNLLSHHLILSGKSRGRAGKAAGGAFRHHRIQGRGGERGIAREKEP